MSVGTNNSNIWKKENATAACIIKIRICLFHISFLFEMKENTNKFKMSFLVGCWCFHYWLSVLAHRNIQMEGSHHYYDIISSTWAFPPVTSQISAVMSAHVCVLCFCKALTRQLNDAQATFFYRKWNIVSQLGTFYTDISWGDIFITLWVTVVLHQQLLQCF